MHPDARETICMTLHDVGTQFFQTSVFFLVLQGHPSAEALGNAGEGQVSLRRSLVISQSPATVQQLTAISNTRL